MTKRQMKLGLSIRYMGYHVGSWRHPDVPSDGSSLFKSFASVVQKAEQAKLDMVFLADGIGVRMSDKPKGSLCRSHHNVELEPLTLLSALAPITQNIGLVATASTTYNEPFHIARKYGSLDQISGGRVGWNVVTSWSDQEAWNFNMSKQLDYNTRYERAHEFVEVVTGLWDSWDKDAFLLDKESGVFYDDTKTSRARPCGQAFLRAWPPVGSPFAAGAADPGSGRSIGARPADRRRILRHGLHGQERVEVRQGLLCFGQEQAEGFGRKPSDLLMILGLTTIVGRTRAEAQEKYEELESLIDPMVGLQMLYRSFGDLSHLPLDGPVPKPDLDQVGLKSSAMMYYELAQAQGLTIRQLYKKVGMAQEHKTVVGTAEDVADEMEAWFEAGAADGFQHHADPPAADDRRFRRARAAGAAPARFASARSTRAGRCAKISGCRRPPAGTRRLRDGSTRFLLRRPAGPSRGALGWRSCDRRPRWRLRMKGLI